MSLKIFKIFLTILLIDICFQAVVVTAQCSISKDAIEWESRIMAQVDQNGMNQLLRQYIVPVGTQINMICNVTDIIRIVCQQDGKFSSSLPIQKCDEPIMPSVEEVYDDSCSFNTYRVGYRVKTTEFLELYRSCYDRKNVRAVYSKYQTFFYSNLTNRPTGQGFTLDRVITGAQSRNFQSNSILNCFKTLLGNNQRYIEFRGNKSIDRGHLTPSSNFLTPRDMKATFKYINVIPQFNTINRNGGNWRLIETWIDAQTESGPLDVKTGVLEHVLELADVHGRMKKIYLGGARKKTTPVPRWMYKIISDSQRRYVFLVYNNIFDLTPPRYLPCRNITCQIEFSTDPMHGFTYCCDPETTYFLLN